MSLPFSTLPWRTLLVALAYGVSETLALLGSRLRAARRRLPARPGQPIL